MLSQFLYFELTKNISEFISCKVFELFEVKVSPPATVLVTPSIEFYIQKLNYLKNGKSYKLDHGVNRLEIKFSYQNLPI
ncbi:hypothetical protein BLOT_005438 [Blomia tropicalis]|nr:hypothetical protein BLOT_005438 [Blomia tropicalis]